MFQEPSFLLNPLKSVEIDYIMTEKPSDNSIPFSFSLGAPYPCINIRKSDTISDTPCSCTSSQRPESDGGVPLQRQPRAFHQHQKLRTWGRGRKKMKNLDNTVFKKENFFVVLNSQRLLYVVRIGCPTVYAIYF